MAHRPTLLPAPNSQGNKMARTASGSPTSPAGAAEPGDEKEQRQPWTLPIIMPHTLFRNAWDTVMFTVIVYVLAAAFWPCRS